MNTVSRMVSDAVGWFAEAASKLSVRRDTAPIADVDRLFSFASTRAAYIAQKKLYGYLKERMGMSYPRVFEDDAMARSIDIAKMHVFAAALSDITIHAVAMATAGSGLPAQEKLEMAMACYAAGIADNEAQAPDAKAVGSWTSTFAARAKETMWDNVAAGGNSFSESPKALIKWAPIADEHKRYDREIVENSIRFAWNEIRQDLRVRLDGTAVVAEWKSRRAAEPLADK